MECVSDQTSDLASAIGAIFIPVFLNIEIATHKRNDKKYINYTHNFSIINGGKYVDYKICVNLFSSY